MKTIKSIPADTIAQLVRQGGGDLPSHCEFLRPLATAHCRLENAKACLGLYPYAGAATACDSLVQAIDKARANARYTRARESLATAERGYADERHKLLLLLAEAEIAN